MVALTLPRLHWGNPHAARKALMAHGLGSSAQASWQVMEALAEQGWSATAVDLRGHGYAPRANTYTVADFAEDLASTWPDGGDSWDLVIGHSIGAAAAVLATHQPTSWAKKLVLLDPALLVGEERKEFIRTNQLHNHDHSTVEGVRKENPHWHPLDVELRVWSHRIASRFALEHAVLDNPTWDVVAQTKALTIPTLVIGGDPRVDSMFTGEHADDVLGANPTIELVVIDGAGHSPHRDKPAESIEAILRFIR